MDVTLPRIKVFFFLSGSAGLIYEVVWTRLFSDILGSTALSMTMVFSVFLLALAVGAAIFGRVSVYGKAALALYGKLEIGIGLLALAASVLLVHGKSWIAVHVPAPELFIAALCYKLLATALLIGLPVVLMGGTLPVIMNATKEWTLPRRVVAQLYGWNTIGAACGAFAAGFVLIWKLGLTLTLATATSLNVLVGFAALILARRTPSEAPSVPLPEQEEASAVSPISVRVLWLAIAFLSGLTILGYEILWGRISKFLLGDRTIAISALLFVFIVCLGLGSLAAPVLGRRFGANVPRQALKLIASMILLGAFLHLLFVPLAHSMIHGSGLTRFIPVTNEFVRRVLTIWLLILPPIIVLGTVFPLLSWSAREINALPGRIVGNLYFVNTIGACLGAVFAGFALTRWIGTLYGFLTLAGVSVGTSALLLFCASTKRWQKGVAILALGGFVLAAWWFPRSLVKLREGEELLMAKEDEYGVQVVARTQKGTIRVRNNRLQLIWDLGAQETSHAQQMAAHLTVLLADECRDVLNVGTGYGITAGAFTLYDDVRSIETIEILPFLVENQHHFAMYNFDYTKDSRVNLIEGDGRHYLVTSPRTYDIISVNVLDPYLPGSSALYTVDFWETVRDHLRPKGVFNQLFWGADVPLLVKGLNTVFPTVLYFPAYSGTSFNIVAFKDPIDKADLQFHFERLGVEANREILKITSAKDTRLLFQALTEKAWLMQMGFNLMADKTGGRLHTDNFPILEFRWAHGDGGVSIFDSPLVME
jgi:spermidine synthase